MDTSLNGTSEPTNLRLEGVSELEKNVEEGTPFKIMSWNINGMRTINMPDTLKQLNCSILCVQETKLSRKQVDQSQAMPPGYSSYFSFSTNRIGYSGVATFCRDAWTPTKAEDGLCMTQSSESLREVGCYPGLDLEETAHVKFANMDGRTVTTQHDVKLPDGTTRPLTVINVYCPRLRDDPEDPTNNTDFKRTFHDLLHRRAKLLVEAGSFVLLLGDINIAHRMIDQSDITDPKKFIVHEFRELVNDFLRESDQCGFVDTFRFLHPDQMSAFTCWCTRLNARENNYGARIDYIFVDRELAKFLEKAEIHPNVMGSDHCPISATFHSIQCVPESIPPPLATKHYPEFSGQKKLKEFFQAPSNCASNIVKVDKSSASASKKRPIESLGVVKSQKSKRVQTSLSNFLISYSKPKPMSINSESTTCMKSQETQKLSNEDGFVEHERSQSSSSTAWKLLMKVPEAPLCSGHQKACARRTVKKKGVNFGRQFWACSHGVGKSDDPNANCNFFQWVKSTK